MGFLAKSLVVMVLGAQSVLGSPAPVADPAITPAPILPRAVTKTLGYYTEGGSTSWESWLYDGDLVSYTTSGNFFRRCSVGINCAFYTSCSSGWMVGASGSTYCGAPTATGTFASNFCSWHVLQPSLSAAGGGLSWFWCDQAPLTGYTFFAKAPAAVTPTPVSSAGVSSARVTPANTRSGGASSTAPDTPTGPTTTTPGAASSTAPAADNNNKSSTPVGAIAGGVVGGIAVLGAIAFAIFFIMRRDKAKKASAAQSAPLMGQQTAYNTQQPQGYPQQTEYYGAGGAPPGVGGYPTEQKPVPAPTYYPPQPYPHGPYDPHVAQAYNAPTPQPGTAELGAPVTFAPQELPAQQVPSKK